MWLKLAKARVKKINFCYLDDRHTNFRKLLMVYFFFWCIISGAVFSVFYLTGKSFIWKEDGMHIYIPSLSYAGHYFRSIIKELFQGNFSIVLYDFNYGMGMDTYSLLLNMVIWPFNLIAVLFPMSKVEIAHTMIVLLQYFLSGVSFLYFCRHMKCKAWNSLAGAVVYSFSGYALYAGIKHPHFMIPVILLPLLVMYLDKCMQERKFSFKFAIVVAFSMANSYYFTFMSTIILVLYGLIRYYNLKNNDASKKFILTFVKAAGAYLLGVGMAAFAYMPLLYRFFHSDRTESVVSTGNMLYYDSKYYKNILAYFLGPVRICGYWTVLGFSSIVLVAVIYILIQKKKSYTSMKIGIVLGIGLLLVPAVGYVFSGFNSISNRWCFAVAFIMAFAVALVMDKFETLKDREIKILSVIVLIYGLIVILIEETRDIFSLTAIILLLALLLFLWYCKFYPLKKVQFGFVLFLIVSATVIVNARYLYSVGGYTNSYVEAGTSINQMKDNPLRLLNQVEDDSFYRAEQKDGNQAMANSSLILRYNGVAQFNNVNSSDFLEYMERLNNSGVKDIVLNYNLDGRTALDALASVKYYGTIKGDTTSIPYGYSPIAQDNSYVLYENQLALPIGYTYDSYILQDEYVKLSDLEKQQAMLQSVVLKNEEEKLTNNTVSDLQLSNEKLEIKNMVLDKVVLTDDQIRVIQDKGSISFEIDAHSDAETYIRMVGLTSQSPEYSGLVAINNGNMTKKTYLQGENIIYKTGREDLLFNIGSSMEGTTKITIRFMRKGIFSYEGIEAWSQSMENYEEQINGLKKEALSNVSMERNQISGSVNLSTNKQLCFSIPYSSGWRVYIDGQEEKLQLVNGMYMGVLVGEGKHEIVLKYKTSWLGFGFLLSAVSIALIILLYCVRKYKYTKQLRCGSNMLK